MKNTVFAAMAVGMAISLSSQLMAAPLKPMDPMTTDTAYPALLATLRPEHPRLLALNSDIQAVKTLLASHPNGQQWLKKLKDAGNQVISEPPVEHKLDGPRLLAQSRRALDRIMLLGFLHRLEPNSRYVKRATLEMETACEFPDWNPSHFLDTAEMTNAMAIGYDWFYDDLSAETRRKVREGIIKHGLNEGIKIYDEKKPSWVKGHNNWNQVCNGGLIVGALAIADEEPQISGAILKRGKESLEHGMALFKPDGAWLEAPSYWVYTMKYTTHALGAMYTALGTAFGLDQVEGFSNTGNFMIAMEGPTGKYFNWGDCSETAGNLPEMFWLARRFNNAAYAGAGEAHMSGSPGPMELIWYAKGKTPKEAGLPLDWYFRDSEVVSLREKWDDGRASFVAMKGGDNNAPHSNVDLGSFVFDTDGQRWAMELGGDNYNLPNYWKKKERLYIYRIRTEGQNTLMLNGQNQELRAKSKIVKRGGNDTSAFAVADLSKAYRSEVSSAQRGVRLDGNRRHLIVQDEIDPKSPLDIVWCMHTEAAVSVAPDGRSALLELGNSKARVSLIEPANAKISVESAEQKPPQRSNKGISRVVVKHKADTAATRLIVQLSPGSAETFVYQAKPLADW